MDMLLSFICHALLLGLERQGLSEMPHNVAGILTVYEVTA